MSTQSLYSSCHACCCGRIAVGSRVLRSSARPLHAVLHRDVGALQLLRHARVPDALHGRARQPPADSASPTRTPPRSTAPTPAASGERRSLGGIIADRFLGQYNSVLIGGIIIALGHFALAFKALPFFYAGLALDRRRHRTAQAERQHAGRIALRTGRCAPRRRLLDLLHGHQPRRAVRPADRRLPRAARRLAHRLRLRRRRHDARPRPVRRRPQASRPGHRTSEGGRRTGSGRAVSRIHGGRMEADGRDRDLLPRRRHLLGRLRAGRIDAEPVRRSLHADRAVRLLVPLVVVPVGAAGVRDPARTGLRLDLGAARHGASRRCRRSSRSACCSWRWRS